MTRMPRLLFPSLMALAAALCVDEVRAQGTEDTQRLLPVAKPLIDELRETYQIPQGVQGAMVLVEGFRKLPAGTVFVQFSSTGVIRSPEQFLNSWFLGALSGRVEVAVHWKAENQSSWREQQARTEYRKEFDSCLLEAYAQSVRQLDKQYSQQLGGGDLENWKRVEAM